MAYEMRDGSGTLFKVQEKKNEKGPDYTGDCMIGGEVYRMAAWIRESESGRKFMSFKFEPKEQQQAKPAKPASKGRYADEDSDVPF
jgi:uncharacterized protein (DUF736 family)